MAKKTDNAVNMRQFRDQVSEQVSPYRWVNLDDDGENRIMFRVTLPVDLPEANGGDGFLDALESAGNESVEGMALVVLGYRDDGVTAEEQWQRWLDAGYDNRDFMLVYREQSQAAQEALGKFRYRR